MKSIYNVTKYFLKPIILLGAYCQNAPLESLSRGHLLKRVPENQCFQRGYSAKILPLEITYESYV